MRLFYFFFAFPAKILGLPKLAQTYPDLAKLAQIYSNCQTFLYFASLHSILFVYDKNSTRIMDGRMDGWADERTNQPTDWSMDEQSLL